MWVAYFSQWDTAARPTVVLVDGIRRTVGWARAHVSQPSVWGFEVSAVEAKKKRYSDPAAANGALVITTWAHAPAQDQASHRSVERLDTERAKLDAVAPLTDSAAVEGTILHALRALRGAIPSSFE